MGNILIKAPYIHVWNSQLIKMKKILDINPAFLVISLKLKTLAWLLPEQDTGLLGLGLFHELHYFRSKPHQSSFVVNIESSWFGRF